MGAYVRPDSLIDALSTLQAGRFEVLAGGTDFYPARADKPIDEDVLDVSRVHELRGIREEKEHLRIGALTTWSDIVREPLPRWLEALKLAAREIGGVQIQNAGTVAGNLCNASPAADGVPVLMALDAKVELSKLGAQRMLPLSEFILGSRRTARKPDELVSAVLIPNWGASEGFARSDFQKLGARTYLVISIVMVAAAVEINASGAITRCGIAVGSCSAVAQRLRALEHRLLGARLSPAVAEEVRASDLEGLTPINDVRSSADYRLDAALQLVRRTLARLALE